MEPHEVDAIRVRAFDTFTSIPAVLWVGYGVKEMNGQLTNDLALRVYVEEKRPREDIPDEEMIPDEFEGIATDVVQIPVSKSKDFGQEDRSNHSPLLSGISITNGKTVESDDGKRGPSLGSIGFFATKDQHDPKEHIFLVTNHHVLAAGGGQMGDTLYQPSRRPGDPDTKRPIGKITELGVSGDVPFQDQGDSQEHRYYADCGLAELSISISSWCDCNCGESYRNQLYDFPSGTELNRKDEFKGIARAVPSSVVHKSGRQTGRTSGTIIDIYGLDVRQNEDGSKILRKNVIIVHPNPPDLLFGAKGDSGGPLIDEQNHLIGLVYGGIGEEEINNGAPPWAFACHINIVLAFLTTLQKNLIRPITSKNPPIGPAGKARSDQHAVSVGLEDYTIILQERIYRTQQGRRILDAFGEHREEIVRLVNHCRPVLVVWHRCKGPAFVAHLRESASRPGHVIPDQIDGQDRRALLVQLADALAEYGSSCLRAFLSDYRDEILRLTDKIGDLHAFVAELEQQERGVTDG